VKRGSDSFGTGLRDFVEEIGGVYEAERTGRVPAVVQNCGFRFAMESPIKKKSTVKNQLGSAHLMRHKFRAQDVQSRNRLRCETCPAFLRWSSVSFLFHSPEEYVSPIACISIEAPVTKA
jgi:hypothetical protein